MTDLEELRRRYPEVDGFVESMYRELEANAHKGDQAGWLLMTLRQAWQEISWHSAKLAVAIKANDEVRMREYAADVANGCMMLVDILDHGEVDRCPACGWVTTVPNKACPWHAMREEKGEVPAGAYRDPIESLGKPFPEEGDEIEIDGRPHVVTAVEHTDPANPYGGGYRVTAEHVP